MVTEFDTGLPSVRQVQALIRDQSTVELKLMTGDTLNGIVMWQDANAICLSINSETVLVMRAAIAYIKAVAS